MIYVYIYIILYNCYVYMIYINHDKPWYTQLFQLPYPQILPFKPLTGRGRRQRQRPAPCRRHQAMPQGPQQRQRGRQVGPGSLRLRGGHGGSSGGILAWQAGGSFLGEIHQNLGFWWFLSLSFHSNGFKWIQMVKWIGIFPNLFPF